MMLSNMNPMMNYDTIFDYKSQFSYEDVHESIVQKDWSQQSVNLVVIEDFVVILGPALHQHIVGRPKEY